MADFENRCVVCGELLVKNEYGTVAHKCKKPPKRKKRESPGQSYCRRLSDGFRMLGKD